MVWQIRLYPSISAKFIAYTANGEIRIGNWAPGTRARISSTNFLIALIPSGPIP